MEEKRGSWMVTIQSQISELFSEQKSKIATVKLSEVITRGKRLEGRYFNVEAKKIREIVNNYSGEKIRLAGLIQKIFVPPQLKRIYADNPEVGVEYLTPSDLLFYKPKANKYVIAEQMKNIEDWYVKEDWLILTQSGTVGFPTLTTKSLEKYIVSQNAIRVIFKERIDTFYLYAFLLSDYGRLILTTNLYGGVIRHIEPEHVENMMIPNPHKDFKKSIAEKIMGAMSLREHANNLLDEAERIFVSEGKLQDIKSLKKEAAPLNKKFVRRAKCLDMRLDGSFHSPLTNLVLSEFEKSNFLISNIGSSEVSEEIILPGRFKRHYVNKEYGLPFLSGKNILQVNPLEIKYLSKLKHKKILSSITLKKNIILVTRSGTIGRTMIAPEYYENFSATEHVIRIISSEKMNPGYIYCFLASEYGRVLINKFTYGAVVDEIDDHQLASVPFPLPKDRRIIDEIGDLVLEANHKRNEAKKLEDNAVAELEKHIGFI